MSHPRPAPPVTTHGLPCRPRGVSPSASPQVHQKKTWQKKGTKNICTKTKGDCIPRAGPACLPLSLRPGPPPLGLQRYLLQLLLLLLQGRQGYHLPDFCLPREGQDRRGRLLIPEEHSEGRRSRVYPLTGLPNALPQLSNLGGPSPELDEEVAARLSLLPRR